MLDLGQISGVIGLDDGPFNKVLDTSKTSLKKWSADQANEAEKGGQETGKRFSEKFLKAAALVGTGALAVGGVFVAALTKGMNLEPATDKVAASLGLTTVEAEKAAKAAGKVYTSNWGESMEDAAERTGVVISSIAGMREASADEVARMTGLFSGFADGFEVDISRATQVVGQMVSTGLASNAEEGLDLLTASLQKVPVAVREDVMDAVDEYGPFMKSLGISGEAAMTLLADSAEKGMFGIDKTGDALKEFTIRATDMSSTTGGAYKALGLSQEKMTQDLLAGGEQGSQAFAKIIGGLESMEDPVAQSQAALALFGTPLEDLNASEIPKFIERLANMDGGLGDVAGASQRMGEQMSGNASSNIQSFLRTIEQGAVEYIGGKFLPALTAVTGELNSNFGPFLAEAGRNLEGFGGWLRDNAGWLQGTATAVGVFGGALAALGLVGYISSLGGISGALTLLQGKIVASTVVTYAQQAALLVASGASKVFAAGQWLVNAALSANPIGLVVLALAGLVAAFVFAYQNSEDFRRIVDGALGAVKAGADAVVQWFNNDFLGFWKGAFDSAKTTVEGWGRGVDDTVKAVQNWFSDTGKKIGDFAGGVGKSMGDAAQWVDDRGKDVRNFVASHFGDAMRVGTSKLGELADGARNSFDGIKSFFGDWSKAFGKLMNGDFEGFNQDANKIMGRMKDGLVNIFNGVKDGAKRIWDMLPDDLKRPIQDAVRWINDTFVGGINGMLGKLSISFRVPQIPGFAGGGYTGNGGKYDPAGVVHKGEVVFSQDDVAAWGGPEAVDTMRRARGQARDSYAEGGIVGGGGLAAYQASVRRVAQILAKTFNVPVPYSGPQGRPQQGRFGYVSDHPRGMAFDVMMPSLHNPLGYRINDWLHANAGQLALKYTVWDRYSYPLRLGGRPGNRINRGDPTNNHEDHVHASFQDRVAPLGNLAAGGGGFDFGIGDLIKGLLKNFPSIGSPWGDIAKATLAKLPEGIAKAVFGSAGFSMGTRFADPGVASVAESGMELVLGKSVRNFRGGEQVLNATDTGKLFSTPVVFERVSVHVSADDMDQVSKVVRVFEDLALQALMPETVG